MDQKKPDDGDEEESFAAEVKIAGINPYVDVPDHAVNVLGGGKVAVLVKVSRIGPMKDDISTPSKKGRLEKDAPRLEAVGRLAPGAWFRTTLVPLRSDATRLYLDTWMRDTSGVSVGDRVQIILKLDYRLRELTMPVMLRDALNENEQAKAAWERLAPSRQREILSYLNFLKTPAALERNVQKTITQLVAKKDRLG